MKSGSHRGYRYSISEGPAISAPELHLQVTVNNPRPISEMITCVQKVGGRTPIGFRSQPIDTGDDLFDSAVAMQTTDPVFAVAVFRSRARRMQILKLFGQGAIEIVFQEDKIKATFPPGKANFSHEDELMPVVNFISQLTQDLPSSTPRRVMESFAERTRARVSTKITIVSILILPLMALLFYKVAYQVHFNLGVFPLLPPMIVTLTILAFIILTAIITSPQKYWFNLHGLFLICLNLPSVIFLSATVTVWYNCSLDLSEGIYLYTNVVGKKQLSNNKVEVLLESWGDPARLVNISMSNANAADIKPYQKKAKVLIKPGRLGYSWIADIKAN